MCHSEILRPICPRKGKRCGVRLYLIPRKSPAMPQSIINTVVIMDHSILQHESSLLRIKALLHPRNSAPPTRGLTWPSRSPRSNRHHHSLTQYERTFTTLHGTCLCSVHEARNPNRRSLADTSIFKDRWLLHRGRHVAEQKELWTKLSQSCLKGDMSNDLA